MASTESSPQAKPEADTARPTPQRWRVRDALRPPFTLDLVWVLLPFSLVLLCFAMLPLRSWDYWWHITMGRLLHQYGAIPAANHFLYTMPPDAPSFVQPWLSQWIFFGLHDLGGLQSVLLLRNLIAATVAALLGFGAMRLSRSAMHGAVLTLLAFALAFPYIAARPHLFVLLLFVLLIWLGYRIRRGQLSLGALLLFPATTVLWANLHGSFFVPAAIALAFGAAALVERFDPRPKLGDVPDPHATLRRSVAWFIAFALTLAAPLLNPRGAQLYGYVQDLATNPEIQETVTEWMSATLTNPPGVGILFYLLLCAGVVIFWRNRRTVDAVDVFLFAGFALMTIFAARSMLWFALILPWTLAAYLPESSDAPGGAQRDTPPPGWLRAVNLLVGLGLLLSALLLQPGTVFHRDFLKAYPAIPTRDEVPLSGLVEAETPVISAAILQQHPGPIHLFHEQKFAGFLLFHLARSRPEPWVFVDQRIELPPPHVWQLYYDAIHTPAWKGIFQEYDISAALLSKETQPELVKNMRAEPGWEIRHENAYNILFIQKN